MHPRREHALPIGMDAAIQKGINLPDWCAPEYNVLVRCPRMHVSMCVSMCVSYIICPAAELICDPLRSPSQCVSSASSGASSW